jgi:peptidoglycan/xylan/chitin deacetylase (PgdA/CDA1 family)
MEGVTTPSQEHDALLWTLTSWDVGVGGGTHGACRSRIRDLAAEGMFGYGARCGVWRVLRTLQRFDVTPTIFACALALERNPELASAIRESRSDVCCHGWRWEDHIAMDEATERERIAKAVASLRSTLGAPPSGWYGPPPPTRCLTNYAMA